MLDLAFVRTNLPQVEEKLRARGADASVLADFATLDAERRTAITEAETLKAQRNALSAEFGKLKREGADTTAVNEKSNALKAKTEALEAAASAADEKLRELLINIPNLPQDSVPLGKSEHDNVCEKTWGQIPYFDFPAKPHW